MFKSLKLTIEKATVLSSVIMALGAIIGSIIASGLYIDKEIQKEITKLRIQVAGSVSWREGIDPIIL
jgi:hypothetical protein